METKVSPIQDLKLREDNGKFYIEGYANTKGQEDSHGHIPTSFEGKPVYSIDRMKDNPVCLVDHQNSAANIAGNFVELKEDDKGLFFKLLLRSLEKIYNIYVKDAVQSYMDGFGRALSIGGRWFFEDEDNLNHLTKAYIFEISLVGIGSDGSALTNVDYPKMFKVPTTFQDLFLSERDRKWNSTEAKKRLQKWAGDLEDSQAQAKYRKAFLWYDSGKPELLGSYKLPIADILDGKLKAIPKGVFAAAGAVIGARGGVDIPDNDKKSVINHINKYYKKMDLESPFKNGLFKIHNLDDFDPRTLEGLLGSGKIIMPELKQRAAKKFISSMKREVLDEQRDVEALSGILDSIKKINSEV